MTRIYKTFFLPFNAKSCAIVCRSEVELEFGAYAFKIDLGNTMSPKAASEQTGLVWSTALNSLYHYSKYSEPLKWSKQVNFMVPPGTSRVTVEAVQWKNRRKSMPPLQYDLTAVGMWEGPNVVTVFGENQND